MSPRGRPKKRKITIKSKETQIIMGIITIGLGITFMLADSIDGAIPNFLFYAFGEGVTPMGLVFVLLGLKAIGFKHKITEDTFLTGLFGLSILYVVFLGYIKQVFGAKSIPGVVGSSINDYFWALFGTYLEVVIIASAGLAFLSLMVGPEILEWVSKAVNSVVGASAGAIVGGWQIVANKFRLLLGKIRNRDFNFKTKTDAKDSDRFPQIMVEGGIDSVASSDLLGSGLENGVGADVAEGAEGAEGAARRAAPSAQTPKGASQTDPTLTQTKLPTQSGSLNVEFGPSLIDKRESADSAKETKDIEIPSWISRFIELYKARFVSWQYPNIKNMFLPQEKDTLSSQELEETTKRIEEVLESFKIHARVSKVFVGPSVIQYALNIATGVKVSKVRNLAKDIALAIAAPSDSIRIDTIAGTSLVGIEVPRRKPRTVRAIEVLDSPEFKQTPYEIPLAIGKDIHGKPVILNLYDMPHILIAGATGSGKSVAINTILAGLLTKFNPDELKLIMVDPKMVEMEPYNDIPHLLVPVITDMNHTVLALDWLIFEMQERYKLFKHYSVRNLKEYNAKSEHKLPWIVLVIDEMADLILTKRNEVETKIVRLAQLARATGIHLILATQRPSVNVITGLIKANIPARIALAVSSGVDSRVILDTVGAETLLGKGDMLIKTPNKTRLSRVQGAFASTEEINKLTNCLKEQAKKARGGQIDWYIDELLNSMQGASSHGPGAISMFSSASKDPLLEQAIELVVREQRVSASALQRYLKIGFNRAARLIDEMEKMGIVSPLMGNKRKVLISDLSELEV